MSWSKEFWGSLGAGVTSLVVAGVLVVQISGLSSSLEATRESFETRLVQIEQRFGSLETRLTGLDQSLSNQIGRVDQNVGSVASRMDSLGSRIDKLNGDLNDRLHEMRRAVEGQAALEPSNSTRMPGDESVFWSKTKAIDDAMRMAAAQLFVVDAEFVECFGPLLSRTCVVPVGKTESIRSLLSAGDFKWLNPPDGIEGFISSEKYMALKTWNLDVSQFSATLGGKKLSGAEAFSVGWLVQQGIKDAKIGLSGSMDENSQKVFVTLDNGEHFASQILAKSLSYVAAPSKFLPNCQEGGSMNCPIPVWTVTPDGGFSLFNK